jgi:hypothetical protein
MKKVDWPKRMAVKERKRKVAALSLRLKSKHKDLFEKTVHFAEIIEGLLAQISWLIAELEELAGGFAGLARSSPLFGLVNEAKAYDRASRILYAEVRRRKLALENEQWERRGDELVRIPPREQESKDAIIAAIAQTQKEIVAWSEKLVRLTTAGNAGVAAIKGAIPELVERANEKDSEKVAAILELNRRVRLTDEEQRYTDMRLEKGGRNDLACEALKISNATGSRLRKSIRQKFIAAGIPESAFEVGAAKRFKQTPDGDIGDGENQET